MSHHTIEIGHIPSSHEYENATSHINDNNVSA
jgi:hypothetical protein